MKIHKVSSLIFLILFFNVTLSFAEGLPWKDHRAPFNFLFGNHIDTHQQTQIRPDGELFGFLYISYTGEKTDDGIPIAVHKNCNDKKAKCSAGWEIRGIPGRAVFLSHERGDLPLWTVSRENIPVPGAYTHFHWLGLPLQDHDLIMTIKQMDGYFLQLKAKATFLFKHANDAVLVTKGIDTATHTNIVSGAADGRWWE